MANTYYTYSDKSQGCFYEAIIFKNERVVVTVPSDPLGDEITLYDYGAEERRGQIERDAQMKGDDIDWRRWKYFEVRPDPERLYIRTSTLKERRRFLFFRDYHWVDGLTCHFDFAELDNVARKNNRPTINEYYARVQFERTLKKQTQDTTMRMLETWTKEYPITELLSILHRDYSQNLDKVRACNWGWHYVLYAGPEKYYYKCANTEFMLRSFIVQAEDCFRKDIPVRFAYCLPQYMPEGIEYQIAPCQD